MKKRVCGKCTLCCTLTRVPELNKPERVTCPFVTKCKGCHIYPDRPQSCRDFKCAWLQGDMPDWMQPNKSHVMIEKLPGGKVILALPEPGHEKTWLTPKVDKVLKEYQDQGMAVVAPGRALVPKGWTTEKVVNEVKQAAKEQGL